MYELTEGQKMRRLKSSEMKNKLLKV
jgi:hypothetical protein